MSDCPRATGERVREAATEIRTCDGVLAVHVLDPAESGRGQWTIEIITSRALPPGVLQRLARHDLSVPDAVPRGTTYRSIATA